MRWRNSEQAYGGVAVTAHWVTVVCVIFAWGIGTFLGDFPRGPVRDGALFVHMTLGLTIFACLVIRLVWRFVDPPPPAIASPRFDPWLGLAAKAGHFVLYALLIVTPTLGVVVQFARGQPLPLFGIFDIASPWAFDREFFREIIRLHQLAANTLGVVAILHAVVALVHRFLGLRDGTLGAHGALRAALSSALTPRSAPAPLQPPPAWRAGRSDGRSRRRDRRGSSCRNAIPSTPRSMRSITCSAQTAAATSRRVAGSSSSPSKRSASQAGTLAPARRAKLAVCLKFCTGTMPGTIGIVDARRGGDVEKAEIDAVVEEELGDRAVGAGVDLALQHLDVVQQVRALRMLLGIGGDRDFEIADRA